MKYPIILLSLILSLSSCYQYAEQTYPTLDGTYILRSVTVNGTDVLNSEITNETYDNTIENGALSGIGLSDQDKLH